MGPVATHRTSPDVPVARSGGTRVTAARDRGRVGRALRRIEADDDPTAVSMDLSRRFPPPERAEPAKELGRLAGGTGRGLFGNSDVFVTETPSAVAARTLLRNDGSSA